MARPRKKPEEPLKNPRFEDILILIEKKELPNEHTYGVVYKYSPNPKHKFFREYYPLVTKYAKEVLLPAIQKELQEKGLPCVWDGEISQHITPSKGIMAIGFLFTKK